MHPTKLPFLVYFKHATLTSTELFVYSCFKWTRDNWLLISNIYSPARQQYGSSACWLRKPVPLCGFHCPNLFFLSPQPPQPIRFNWIYKPLTSNYACNRNTLYWGKQATSHLLGGSVSFYLWRRWTRKRRCSDLQKSWSEPLKIQMQRLVERIQSQP